MTDPRPVVLAVQNDPTDPPLLLGEWLVEDGLRVDVLPAFDGSPVPTEVPDGVHGIVVLGGEMGASDDAAAPWLPAVRSLMADAVGRDVPLLGLCLGGQLLAVAAGGAVGRADVVEIGLVDVQRTLDGLRDPVAGAAVPASGADIPSAQWHQDEVTTLPDDAVLLLTGTSCRVQGFRVGDSAYGLQLHPELDAATFADWTLLPDELLARSGIDPAAASADVAAAEPSLVAAWRPLARAWADLVWERVRERAVAAR